MARQFENRPLTSRHAPTSRGSACATRSSRSSALARARETSRRIVRRRKADQRPWFRNVLRPRARANALPQHRRSVRAAPRRFSHCMRGRSGRCRRTLHRARMEV